MKRDLLKTIVLMVSIVLVTIGSSLLLNLVTGPKIAADKAYRDELAAQQAAGALLEVLPGATGFEEITSTLTLDPASGVTAVHKETSGKGYVFIASVKGYSQIVEVTVGVDSEGKVAGLIVNTNGDFAVKQETIDSYIGQDSTLAGTIISSGATVSSNAVKSAVSNGMMALAANGLMQAAAKSVEQIYEEELLTVYPGFVIDKQNGELAVSGDIARGMKASNGSGVVCYVNSGDTKVLAIYNIAGVVKVYQPKLLDEATQDYELEEITSTSADIITKVTEFASTHVTSKQARLDSKIAELYPTATDITAIEVTTFGDVVAAASFVVDGATYYGFYARPNNSFDDLPMDEFIILDAEGKIVQIDLLSITNLFIEGEYFNLKVPGILDFPFNDYEDQFIGLGSDSIIDSAFDKAGDFNITGATKTSVAVKDGLNAAYALFNTLQGGNN